MPAWLVQGRAPVHLAVLRSDVDSLESLLAAGATPDARTEGGDTPASIAVQRAEVEVSTAAPRPPCTAAQQHHVTAARGPHSACASWYRTGQTSACGCPVPGPLCSTWRRTWPS